ncbi:hypothetical protein J3459_017058 [Metarhizium acridum]|uniref:uncharacterized protein n=1 Tax=Metarhizium acridum TaxID=92637 RepID=UPI001C6C29CF|nr:hypothetical protein J3459_017058 [Metarhizium acridum]KAG8410851.1 hypothetical protein J3458_016606 [Metarhizium acridum]KAG8411646.1 hypothetical protein J3458_015705 [Metarhizium acridum]
MRPSHPCEMLAQPGRNCTNENMALRRTPEELIRYCLRQQGPRLSFLQPRDNNTTLTWASPRRPSPKKQGFRVARATRGVCSRPNEVVAFVSYGPQRTVIPVILAGVRFLVRERSSWCHGRRPYQGHDMLFRTPFLPRFSELRVLRVLPCFV